MIIPSYLLRDRGVNLGAYFDDIIISFGNFESCQVDAYYIFQLLENLDYIVKIPKSLTIPIQTIEHLGLVINTITMTVKVSSVECDNINALCFSLRNMPNPSFREVAKVVGTMVFYCPGVEFGILHYRNLKNVKFQH